MNKIYTTKILKINNTEQLKSLSIEAGKTYSEIVTKFYRILRKKNIFLSKYSIQKLIKNNNLHSQTVQGLTDKFYTAWDAYKEAKKINPNAKPPKNRKKHFCIIYKESAIKLKGKCLTISNGNHNEKLIFNNWKHDKPKYIEISYNDGYKMSCTYSIPDVKPMIGYIAGIDLGAIQLASIYTQDRVLLYSGKLIRAKQRYANKTKAEFSSMMDKLKKNSRKWRKLNKKKNKLLNKLKRQIKDIEHKQTTHLVETLHKSSVATVVIGDIRNVRKASPKTGKINKKASTQQVNQMPTGFIRRLITYKANRLGMEVKLINEAYTSQTCPNCEVKNKVTNRNYVCSVCGFSYHRDGVGAFNIYKKYVKKYKGCVPVVGVMTPPIGHRYIA